MIRICRYPLAVAIRPGLELEFADAHGGYQSPETAVHINRFVRVPELLGMCRLAEDGSLAVSTLMDLLLCDGAKHAPAKLTGDAWLRDLGVVLARAGELAVGAKAGHNNEHHNHNDVGSFIVARGGTVFLCDPGAPIYSANTFNEHRYESVFINSFGHSVPVIDGGLQSAGHEFAGTIAAEGLGGGVASDRAGAAVADGRGGGAGVERASVGGAGKTIRIEMAKAYPVPNLRRLTRTITLPPGGQEVHLREEYEFASAPKSVEEAFVTFLPAEVEPAGRAVLLPSPGGGSESGGAARLSCDAPGAFAVKELTAESQAESRTGQLLRRITFTPARMEAKMALGFRLARP